MSRPSRVLPRFLSTTLLLASAAGFALFPGCDCIAQSACVTGGTNIYFCENSSLQKCQDFWHEGMDYCAFFEGDSCADVGFPDGTDDLDTFSEPRTPDWSVGTPNGGSAGGGGGGGSGSGSCAYYDSKLNHVVCDPSATSTGCSAEQGKYFGSGSSCSGMSCTSSSDPQSCTNSTSSTGGGGGGTGGCTATYQGPTGDAQVYTQCASVWNYKCQAMDLNAASQNCKVYDSLQATVPCPYCP